MSLLLLSSLLLRYPRSRSYQERRISLFKSAVEPP